MDVIYSQSKGFGNELIQMGIDSSKIHFLPNYSEDFYRPLIESTITRKTLNLPKDSQVLMFAGNIGESQNFELIIESAAFLRKQYPRLFWAIIGDGRFRQRAEFLVNKEGLENVFHFYGSYPPEKMPHFFHHADALIISLRDELTFNLTIPSKLQSYLACQKPIIGIIRGEAAVVIKESQSGIVVDNLDKRSVVKGVASFLNSSQKTKDTMSIKALEYYQENFSRQSVLNRYFEIAMK